MSPFGSNCLGGAEHLSSDLSSSRTHSPRAEAHTGSHVALAGSRLACTAAKCPSEGLGCIHQHPGECKHLILAPFEKATGRERLVPWRLGLGRAGLTLFRLKTSYAIGFLKTGTASNMGFLPVLETGSLGLQEEVDLGRAF